MSFAGGCGGSHCFKDSPPFPEQYAYIAAKYLLPAEEEKARERQLAAQNNDAGQAVRENLPEQAPEGRARDLAAAKVGLSGKTVDAAAGLLRTAMAIAEACQLWIEQRIEEELQDKNETGKSLREIGRELAAEIEKVFEAKVDAETLFQRARRQADTNVSPPENQATTLVQGGCSGCKLSPQEVVKETVNAAKSFIEAELAKYGT